MTASKTGNKKVKKNTTIVNNNLSKRKLLKNIYISKFAVYSISFIIISILLLSNTLFMFCDRSFFYNQYEKLNIYDNFNESTVYDVTESMLDYLTFKTNDVSDFFSEREKLHMVDVKNLVKSGDILLISFSLILGIIFYYLYNRPKTKHNRKLIEKAFINLNINSNNKTQTKSFQKHSKFMNFYDDFKLLLSDVLIKQGFMMCGLLVLAFLLRKSFRFFFILMHKVLFSNDLWILNPEYDKMILILPNQFFINATAVIIIRSLVISIVLMLIGFWIARKKK